MWESTQGSGKAAADMSGGSADSARTMAALERLAGVLDDAGGQFGALAERSRALRRELSDGMPLARAIASEARPLITTRMTKLIDDLTTGALAVRRAEARQLQREGLSQQKIAEIFGVTRQRVGVLLAGAAGGEDGPGAADAS